MRTKIEILVVEDNEKDLRMISSMLICAGYKVHASMSVNDAFALFENHSDDISVIILDLLLNDHFESSFQFIEFVNKSAAQANIIVLTGHGSSESAVRAVKGGAFDFVTKPFNLQYGEKDIADLLLPKIKQALKSDYAAKFASRQDKIRAFDEDQLINKIILPLLNQMGFLGVRRNAFHGPGELGKDILPFYKYGEFNERVYYAAQVKAGDISARSGSKANVHVVIDQAKSILRSSFHDKFDNTRKKIDRCLIICSGKISNDAKCLLDDVSKGRRTLLLLEAEDLLRLYKNYNLLQYLDRL